jgi:hypothetical protein
MSRTCLPLILIVLACVAAKPVDEATAARYAVQAQEERTWAARIRDEPASLAGDYHRLGGFIKVDLAKLREACEAEAKVHDAIAAAFDRHEVAEVQRLRENDAPPTARAKQVWRERILEWRMKQFAAAPSQQWWHETSRYTAKAAMPELLAWGEARKAAADAWGAVAEAFVPGHDPVTVAAAKDRAYAADAEREIAEWRYEWARDRERLLENKKFESDDLARAVAKLKEVQEERVKLRRAEIDRDRRAREVERSLKAAEVDFRKTFEAAEKEHQRRLREKNAKR